MFTCEYPVNVAAFYGESGGVEPKAINQSSKKKRSFDYDIVITSLVIIICIKCKASGPKRWTVTK